MLVHRRVTPSIKFAGTHLYTWVERGTVRLKCLPREHNTMSPTRAQNQTTHSRVKHTNHEATALPIFILKIRELKSSGFIRFMILLVFLGMGAHGVFSANKPF